MSDQSIVKTTGAPGSGGSDGATGSVPAAPPKAAPKRFGVTLPKKKWPLLLIALIALGGLAYFGWQYFQPPKLPPGFVSSNGRIEATEIDVAAKIAGRIRAELVDEGDFVTAGQ